MSKKIIDERRVAEIRTHDLGHGWFANFEPTPSGGECLTIRNPDKGQRINLSEDSVALLRRIMAEATGAPAHV